MTVSQWNLKNQKSIYDGHNNDPRYPGVSRETLWQQPHCSLVFQSFCSLAYLYFIMCKSHLILPSSFHCCCVRFWWTWVLTLTKRAVSSWHQEEACTASTSMSWRPTTDKLSRYKTSTATLVNLVAADQQTHSNPFLCSLSGQPDAQRLADDFCFRRGPGRDQRSCHERRPGDYGKGGQGLPQTGERQLDGRLEVLHLLRVPGLPLVRKVERERVKVLRGNWIKMKRKASISYSLYDAWKDVFYAKIRWRFCKLKVQCVGV